jgi:hypothetical protein
VGLDIRGRERGGALRVAQSPVSLAQLQAARCAVRVEDRAVCRLHPQVDGRRILVNGRPPLSRLKEAVAFLFECPDIGHAHGARWMTRAFCPATSSAACMCLLLKASTLVPSVRPFRAHPQPRTDTDPTRTDPRGHDRTGRTRPTGRYARTGPFRVPWLETANGRTLVNRSGKLKDYTTPNRPHEASYHGAHDAFAGVPASEPKRSAATAALPPAFQWRCERRWRTKLVM